MEILNYKDILDHIYSGVYIVNCDRTITYWNNGAEEITGYKAADVTNQMCYDNFLMHVDEKGKVLCQDGCPLHATILDGKDREAHVYLRHKDGFRVPVMVHASPLHDQNGEIVGAIETFSDNTALFNARKNIIQLSDKLMKDNLTGISNRKYAEIRILKGIEDFISVGIYTGLLFIDIDHFKQINYTYGHGIGDAIIILVSDILAKNIRENDVAARWGGEEFVIVLDQINPYLLKKVAEKIRNLVEASGYHEGGKLVSVTVSIGATLLQPGDSVEIAIKRADKLMYQSKESGRNRTTSDVL